MKVFQDTEVEWEPVDPAHFTGKGRVKRVSATDQDPSVKVFRVEFEPESRTNWHSHSGVQLLYIVGGRCRVQKWGEEVKQAGPGDMVSILPDEKHWHGAGPGSSMTHIAVNINVTTSWMEKVTEKQFSALSA